MKAKNLLLAKSKVSFLTSDTKVKDALFTMRKVGYSMIPVIDRDTKKYLFSISHADILSKIIDDKGIKCFKKPITEVPQTRFIAPSTLDVEIKDLTDLLANQNYVPIVDNEGIFKGIITRKAFIYYLSTEKAN